MVYPNNGMLFSLLKKNEEILALGLGKMEAMGSQKGLHDLDIGYVNHSVHLIIE